MVFIMDVVEGIIPYNKAVLDYEIEEERRLMYVAMTRAKKKSWPSVMLKADITRIQPFQDLLLIR